MSELHLLIGPVGSGKSTWARARVAERPALFLDTDRWMVRLYGEDTRPASDVLAWYLARRERVRGLMWDVAREAIRSGGDVFLELGLVTAERAAAHAQGREASGAVHVHLFEAPRAIRRERVQARNLDPDPFTQVVPPQFFERASDAWEPVTDAERAAWSVVDHPHAAP